MNAAIFIPVLLLAAGGQFHSTMWPERLGDWERVSTGPAEVPSRPLLEEYGLVGAEQADYRDLDRRMLTAAYRFRDTSGAWAAYLLLRPADAQPSKFDDHAASSAGSTYVLFGSYVFRFAGGLPRYDVYEELLAYEPGMDNTPLPKVKDTLPLMRRVPNSERFLAGPDSLAAFFPTVPPAVAAFRTGAQGAFARYEGGLDLAVFDYGSVPAAAPRCAEFEKLPGVRVRCTGQLVAVTGAPGEAASALLGAVGFPPEPRRPVVEPVSATTSTLWLAGVIAVLAGLAFLLVYLLRRKATIAAADPGVKLGLDGH